MVALPFIIIFVSYLLNSAMQSLSRSWPIERRQQVLRLSSTNPDFVLSNKDDAKCTMALCVAHICPPSAAVAAVEQCLVNF